MKLEYEASFEIFMALCNIKCEDEEKDRDHKIWFDIYVTYTGDHNRGTIYITVPQNKLGMVADSIDCAIRERECFLYEKRKRKEKERAAQLLK